MLRAVAHGAALSDVSRASLLDLAALGLNVHLWAKVPPGVPEDHCATGELSTIRVLLESISLSLSNIMSVDSII